MAVKQLGCSNDHSVYIADRAGNPLRQIPWQSYTCGRVLDDFSIATLNLGEIGSCCKDIEGLVPWAYRINIYVDGQRIWTGPVVGLSTEGGVVTIEAADLMVWLTRRLARYDRTFTDVDLSEIFNQIVDDAMAVDNYPGLYPTATPTGILGTREYLSSKLEYAYDVVQELARTGIDYTMVDDVMVAGSFVIPTPPIAYITENALTSLPAISVDGRNQSNVEWVGSQGGEEGFSLLGTFSSVDAFYGVLENSSVEDRILDQASIDQAAKTRWDLHHDPQVIGSSLALSPSAPLTREMLVPGAVVACAITETCIPLVGEYRLVSVEFSAEASTEGFREGVTVGIEPVGTVTL